MVWPFKPPVPDDVASFGRTHNVLAEVNYEDGVDNWWHQGRLCVADGGEVEVEWDPATQRWTFRQETSKGPGPLDSIVVNAPPTTLQGATKRRSRMRHRIYWFADVAKKDRRYLHTADLDLIHSAPQISYNKTNKGGRRFQNIAFASMGSIDLLTLVLMFSLLTGVQNSTTATTAISNAAVGLTQVILWPASLLALYWWMGRRTLVLVIDVRPVIMRIGSPKNELVYLTNSVKEPAPNYLRRLFGLPSAAVDRLGGSVSQFQTETINHLQEIIEAKDLEMDRFKLSGERQLEQRIDLKILSDGQPTTKPSIWVPVVVAIAVTATVAVLATYAALLSGV